MFQRACTEVFAHRPPPPSAPLAASVKKKREKKTLSIQPCYQLHPVTRSRSNKDGSCGWERPRPPFFPLVPSHDSLWTIFSQCAHRLTQTLCFYWLYNNCDDCAFFFFVFSFDICLLAGKPVPISCSRDFCLPCCGTPQRERGYVSPGNQRQVFLFMSVLDIRDMLQS